MKRIIFISLLAVFLIMQFFRPKKNTVGSDAFKNDIATIYEVPEDVHKILKVACFDCHSNHTNYPWYAEIQPVGWWLQQHIDEGKRSLNFNKFGSYSKEDQVHVLKEIAGEIQSNRMPLESYISMHKEAKLSPEQKQKVIEWCATLSQTIASEQKIRL